MSPRLEAADHEDIFIPHSIDEQTVDLGEIRMNYATLGDRALPALLLIPAQTESWWAYEKAMHLLANRYQVFAVDLRGQGRTTWTPGRYSLDVFGDLVRFISRPTIISGLSSGGTIAAWLTAYAKPGQIRAAVFEDSALFASASKPLCGAVDQAECRTDVLPLAQMAGPAMVDRRLGGHASGDALGAAASDPARACRDGARRQRRSSDRASAGPQGVRPRVGNGIRVRIRDRCDRP